jgi:outer membrane protein
VAAAAARRMPMFPVTTTVQTPADNHGRLLRCCGRPLTIRDRVLGELGVFSLMVERSVLWRTASSLAGAAFLTASLGGVAQAETLLEALASAYAGNPQINQERAQVRATDERLAEAQAGFRPQVTANAEYGVSTLSTSDAEFQLTDGSAPTENQILSNRRSIQRNDGFFNPSSYTVQVQQQIFDGFSTLSAVREAEATIGAARENLRSVEQRVLYDGIRAYASVLRDRAIADLRENNVKILSRELAGTRERLAAGEVTRTDLAQAESRKARSVADLDLARANLASSLADYERIVGHPANALQYPAPADGLLPATLDEAIEISAAENPDVVEAAFAEKAGVQAIARIRGELLPQVTLNASHQERFDFSNSTDNQQSQSVTARLSVPLYSGGDVEARIRAAKQRRQGQLAGIEQARQQMRAQTIAAWSQLVANRSQLEAVQSQVRSSSQALEGVREEQKGGQRTLLDVLNAEQELLDSKITLERSRRDLIVASYAVLSAMGRLTATQLGLTGELYDVEDNYRRTNRRAWGIRIERDDSTEGFAGLAAVVDPDWAAKTGN